MSFVQLQVTSSYSLLQSTWQIDDLVKTSKKRGYSAIALTDRNVLYGLVDFFTSCQKEGIQPILGLTLDLAGMIEPESEFPLVLLALNKKGYQSLIKLSSQKMLLDEGQRLNPDCLGPHAEHLIAITPGEEGEIEQALLQGEVEKAKQIAQSWKELFSVDHFYLGVQLHKPLLNMKEDLLHLSHDRKIPVTAMHDVRYADEADHFAVQVLDAIDRGEKLTDEMDEKGFHYLPSVQLMKEAFEKNGLKEAADRTVSIAEQIHSDIPLHKSLLPRFPLEGSVDRDAYLKEQTETGLKKRIPSMNRQYSERLEKELSVIINMGFADYFLIVWDLMKYAREHHILTGAGRGSAAGSLVAFSLGITDVDPIEYDLLFERFLNEERYTLPDIDLDFPDDKRGQMLHYVKRKYGKDHVAQIATFGTLAAKMAIRDTGRVFGLDTSELSTWSKAIPSTPGITLSQAIRESSQLSALVKQSPQNKRIFDTAAKIEGLPRHVSTHAAGVVISEQALDNVVPLQKGSGELVLTQYPMGNVEEIGLLKMDFLGLKNLTILSDALDFIRSGTGETIDIKNIPLDDQETLGLFRRGDTSGIFQFESDGIRRVLKRLSPNSIEDVVAVNALYRPGPMEQIDVFIKRKKGKEPISYPHPDLEDILSVTYGVMVYQEQVMRVASKMAGYTLGEADILRRAISKKDREVIEEERHHFRKGAVQNGYDEEIADEVYHYIERFADYGFNRSHAVAYSFIAYQMAYLKTHYPHAFFASLLKNAASNGEKAKEYLLEAKRKGIRIFGPDINRSQKGFSVHSNGILFGLESVKGVRKDFIRHILTVRENQGAFSSMIHFLKRVDARWRKKEYIEPLIYTGAFDQLGANRASLVYSLEGVLSSLDLSGDNIELFEVLQPKVEPAPDLSEEEKLEKEFQYIGFYLSGHPSEQYDDLRSIHQIEYVQDLRINHSIRLLGSIQSVKRIQTKRGEPMAFAELSDSSGSCSLTFFPEQYRKLGQHLQKGELVVLEGKTEQNRGELQVIVNQMSPAKEFQNSQIGKTCYLRVKSRKDAQLMKNIQTILKGHPGKMPVILYEEDSGGTFRMKTPFWIDGSRTVFNQLTDELGEKNVVFS